MYTGARLKLLVAERRSIRCHRATSPLVLGCQDPATKRLRGNTLEFSPGTASKLDIRNFAGAMEDLDLLRNPACEVQAALTTFGVTQPADADALYSLGGRKSFPPRSYLPFSRITFSIRRSGMSHITATIT